MSTTCDLLVRKDVRRLHQMGVDRDRTHVVDVGVGHRRTVDLRLEHRAYHVHPFLIEAPAVGVPVLAPVEGAGLTTTLSIKRAFPTQAATEGASDLPLLPLRPGFPDPRRPRSRAWRAVRQATTAAIAFSTSAAEPPSTEQFGARVERPLEHGRGPPVLTLQVGVPARHRESVRLANRRAPDHLDREVELPGEPPDDDELLGVLLPEVGAARAGDVEQLASRPSPRRRSGPAGSCPSRIVPISPTVTVSVDGSRIHLLDRRMEDEIDALRRRRSRGPGRGRADTRRSPRSGRTAAGSRRC